MKNKYRPLMIFGTSSSAGKSMLVTALCRIFSDLGIDVIPFKVQNMSLNAGVGIGGEMAYAQIIQSRAARLNPSVNMNPILLKPEENKTHIILLGKHYKTVTAISYMNDAKQQMYRKVLKVFEKLQAEHEIVIIEGAGSPAEINLENDIANLKFARDVGAKAILISDIERGGAFASIVGTLDLINYKDVIGIVINKFRGDESLLSSGFKYLENRYHIPVLGTVPYIDHPIPEEDSLRPWQSTEGKIKISIIKIPHIANFTDFEMLENMEDLGLNYSTAPESLKSSDAIIIPGSKLTVSDLQFLKKEGFEEMLKEKYKEGSFIVGICGGYQMLGRYIIDNFESKRGKVSGLNLLDAKTVFSKEKRTSRIFGKVLYPELYNTKIEGYEIHMGYTSSRTHFSEIYKKENKHLKEFDGSQKDHIFGTYFHGLFDNMEFTERFINLLRKNKDLGPIKLKQESLNVKIDKLARVVKKHINIDKILEAL